MVRVTVIAEKGKMKMTIEEADTIACAVIAVATIVVYALFDIFRRK